MYRCHPSCLSMGSQKRVALFAGSACSAGSALARLSAGSAKMQNGAWARPTGMSFPRKHSTVWHNLTADPAQVPVLQACNPSLI